MDDDDEEESSADKAFISKAAAGEGDKQKIKCFKCKKFGHKSFECTQQRNGDGGGRGNRGGGRGQHGARGRGGPRGGREVLVRAGTTTTIREAILRSRRAMED